MSFISEQYYKKLCEMLFISLNGNYNTVDKEVLRRDFASRAYYTAYLHCANTLSTTNHEANGSHNKVISSLGGETRAYMLSLKNMRTYADYNMNPFPENLKIKGQDTKLLRVKAIIEDILKKNEAELSL